MQKLKNIIRTLKHNTYSCCANGCSSWIDIGPFKVCAKGFEKARKLNSKQAGESQRNL